MKKIKRMKVFLSIILLTLALSINAQYNTSTIGLRLGGVSGLSYKFISDNNSGFELILGAKEKGAILTGIVQKYKPLATNRISGFLLCYGGGGHVGYAKHKEEVIRTVDDKTFYCEYEESNPVIGGDFMIGAEYRFESIPLHISLDYKPYFEVFGHKDFRLDLWDIGFTARWVLNN